MTEEEKREVEGERSGWVTLPKDKDLAVNLDKGARPRTLRVDFRWGNERGSLYPCGKDPSGSGR